MNHDMWDLRFLKLSFLVASWSKDPSTKTGAVIVRPDRTVCALGYNGFPRGIDDSEERLIDRDQKYRMTVHCEMNALLTAREPVAGYTLYTTPFISCERCAMHVIQAGITRCVAPTPSKDILARWGEHMTHVRNAYEEAEIELVEIEWDHGIKDEEVDEWGRAFG